MFVLDVHLTVLCCLLRIEDVSMDIYMILLYILHCTGTTIVYLQRE